VGGSDAAHEGTVGRGGGAGAAGSHSVKPENRKRGDDNLRSNARRTLQPTLPIRLAGDVNLNISGLARATHSWDTLLLLLVSFSFWNFLGKFPWTCLNLHERGMLNRFGNGGEQLQMLKVREL